jgi:RNA polymerase sigma-70 factor, ECF subfamily
MSGAINRILQEIAQGDREKVGVLFAHVYPNLQQIAARLLSRERNAHFMEPASLVHEAFLKLVDQEQATWKTRSHFFAVGAEAMRRILVDHARHRQRLKHGGDMLRITLTDLNAKSLSVSRDQDVLTVAEILDKLEKLDPRQAKIVELRFFGGLTLDETSEALGISRRTIAYEWRMTRAWMRAELSGNSAAHPKITPFVAGSA